MGAGGLNVHEGGEVGGLGVAEFVGFKVDDGAVGMGADQEHGIHQTFEMGDAAVDTALVEMMDDDDGGAGVFGHVAEEADSLDEGTGDGLDVPGGEVNEGVEDDEADAEVAEEVEKEVGLGGVGEVPVVLGGDVDGGGAASAEAAVEEGEAVIDGEAAEVFFHVEDGGLEGGMAEPGEAKADMQGEVEHGVGLFGGGIADDEGDAASLGDVLDDPRVEVGGGDGGIPGGGDAEAVVDAFAAKKIIFVRCPSSSVGFVKFVRCPLSIVRGGRGVQIVGGVAVAGRVGGLVGGIGLLIGDC